MINIFEKYGFCIVKKGTYFFREGINVDEINFSERGVFFAFDKNYARADKPRKSDVIFKQNWIVKKDFKVLFAVDLITHRGFLISSVNKIYTSDFKLGRQNDSVHLKQNINQRAKLIKKLQEENIIGWITSFEDNPKNELCLFPHDGNIKDYLEELPYEDENEDFYINHALFKTEFYPSNYVLENSKSEFEELPFKTYIKYFNEDIKSHIKHNKCSEQEAKAFCCRIRHVLKL